MNVLTLRPPLSTCPVCGAKPYCEEVEPWPRSQGKPPWSAGCYRFMPFEHFVGVNGDDELDTIRQWNAEADKIRRGDFSSPAAEFARADVEQKVDGDK